LNGSSKNLRFEGPVKWVAGPGRAGITLLGRIVEPDGGTTAAQLSLSPLESAQLPPSLNDVTFEALTAQDMLLRSGAREWRVPGHAWQLHRDVGATFYAAVPPRPTPLTRRLGWRVLLGLAAIAPGRWLLARLAGVK
jgi:hypothetical protein